MAKLATILISFYRLYVSPLLGRHCKFYPSCSQYYQEAIAAHGFIKGTRMGLTRLLRCHPLSAGGFDPITK